MILVYDVTNPDSFQLLRQWFESIKQENQGRNLTGVVIANKVDLEQKAVVNAEDGQALAQAIGFEFFEVSALQSRGLEEPFKALTQ